MSDKPNWPRCPKCKGQDTSITELWTSAGIIWQSNSKRDEGIMHSGGDPFRVEGACNDCGHTWKLRKVVQVKEEWWEEKVTP